MPNTLSKTGNGLPSDWNTRLSLLHAPAAPTSRVSREAASRQTLIGTKPLTTNSANSANGFYTQRNFSASSKTVGTAVDRNESKSVLSNHKFKAARNLTQKIEQAQKDLERIDEADREPIQNLIDLAIKERAKAVNFKRQKTTNLQNPKHRQKIKQQLGFAYSHLNQARSLIGLLQNHPSQTKLQTTPTAPNNTPSTTNTKNTQNVRSFFGKLFSGLGSVFTKTQRAFSAIKSNMNQLRNSSYGQGLFSWARSLLERHNSKKYIKYI